jgi:hypothetical protein
MEYSNLSLIKKLVFISLFLLIGHTTYGQSKRNNVWVFGDSTCVWFDNNFDPHGVLDTFLTKPNGSNVWGQSSLCNLDGHLKIYGDGCRLFNTASQFISGSPSTGGTSLIKPILLPYLNDSTKVHYFNFSGGTGLPMFNVENCYRAIDLSLNNGAGAVYQVLNLSPDSPMIAGTVAIRHGNGRDWWIVNHRRNGTRFMTFLVQNDSLTGPFFQDIGFYFSNPIHPIFVNQPFNHIEGWGDMCVSGDGSRIAIAIIRGVLITYDFDRCSGEFSNYRLIEDQTDTSEYYLMENPNFISCSFAPRNKDLLYLVKTDQDTIYQYNLADSFPTLTKAQVYAQPPWDSTTVDSQWLGYMSIGPDERIYIQHFSPNCDMFPNVTDSFALYLGRIDNPNLLWPGCSYDSLAVRTHGRGNKIDLMNIVNFDLGAWSGSPCDTLITTALSESKINPQLKVFPNPANDKINITWPVQGGYSWVLKSLAGSSLSSGSQLAGNATISTANLPEGMYFLEVHSAKEHKVEKVLVVR